MTTDTNNGDTVEAGVGGVAPASTVLALYRHALDLCERLGISRPLSLHVWDWSAPPLATVYTFPDEWRPEWGKLRVDGDTASGEAAVEGVAFRCACPLDQAVKLGLVEAA